MTDYNLEFELAEGDYDEDGAHEALLTEFAEFHPAVGVTDRNRTDLIITVQAVTLAGAIRVGMALAEQGGHDVIAVHAMLTEEFDTRVDDVPLPDLVGATEAAEILGVTRQRIQQMATAGQLPSERVGNALVFARATVEALAVNTGRLP